MIVVKCMGEKKDLLRLEDDGVSNVQDLKQLMSQKLNVEKDCIIIKLKGKEINDDDIVGTGMKLIGFIQKPVVKKLAPPPTDVTQIFDETPKECIGYNKKCSFYGRNDTEGYCSLCYKRKLKALMSSEPEKKKRKSETPAPIKTLAPPPDSAVLQTDFEKCWSCKKRIGLLGFECRCGYKFCGLHRHPEQHECGYDYKQTQREQLKDMLSSYAIEENKINRI